MQKKDFLLKQGHVVFISLVSRSIVFLLQMISNVIPDHNADAFKPEISAPSNSFDALLRLVFDGFLKWDAKYMIHVAEHGYVSENSFAFFPMFPLSVHCFALILGTIFPCLTMHTCCLMAGSILNLLFFTAAVIALHNLTILVFEDAKFAFLVSVVFSFNPASIFFSSCYTESMFSFFVFKGLRALRSANQDQTFQSFKSVLWFFLAAATRSNGTVNAGFIFYHHVSCIIKQNNLKAFLLWTLQCVLLCVTLFIPFAAFNFYGYVKFCNGGHVGWNSRPDCNLLPHWCCNTWPLVYDHIQKENWGLGLFAYYKVRKLPNFILASPALVICAYAACKYFHFRKHELLCLGLPVGNFSKKLNHSLKYLNHNLFCSMVHLSFLCIFAALFMHIEVLTRLVFSSTPLPSWVIASYFHRDLAKTDLTKATLILVWFKLTRVSKFLFLYCASYICLGIILHVNFLPWT